jgi:hypothetical protein
MSTAHTACSRCVPENCQQLCLEHFQGCGKHCMQQPLPVNVQLPPNWRGVAYLPSWHFIC